MKEHILVCLASDLKEWKAVKSQWDYSLFKTLKPHCAIRTGLSFVSICHEKVETINKIQVKSSKRPLIRLRFWVNGSKDWHMS